MAQPPQYFPCPRELDDLELLCHGVLDPQRGFEGPDGEVTLTVPTEQAAAGALELVDQEGAPLALLRITASYPAGELLGVTGPVTPYERTELDERAEAPRSVTRRHGSATLTVPVDAPPTVEDLRAIEQAAAGRKVLLLALTGHERPVGCSADGLVRATRAAAALLPAAVVVPVPLARRDDPDADDRLRGRVVAAYAPGEVFEPAGEGPLPEPVTEVLGRERSGGVVVLFTGLSGSGKSTLARALHEAIEQSDGRAVTRLDGDVVRRNLSAGLTFSKQDRETNIRRIGWVAAEISKHGGLAICSPIAPFDETRRQARAMTEKAGGTFLLVHVATPLKECERRDRKGLYAKARRGELAEFTGISSPYEPPSDADIRIDTAQCGVSEAVAELARLLAERTPACAGLGTLAAGAVRDDHEFAGFAASSAGALLLRIREGERTGKELKDAGDDGAQQLLARLLAEHRPGDAVLSEEGHDDERRLAAERVWIVDPVDGTREFAEPPREDWAVHVALWQAGELVAGAVALPALGETFTTANVSPIGGPANRPLRLAVSRTRPPEFVSGLAEALGAETVPMGSAGAKVLAVVRGVVDAYVHAGGQYEWDSAAPVAVARAAGLHTSRIDGAALRYNRPDPLLPDLLVCRPELAEDIIGLVGTL